LPLEVRIKGYCAVWRSWFGCTGEEKYLLASVKETSVWPWYWGLRFCVVVALAELWRLGFCTRRTCTLWGIWIS
jgi:hypothetical protein